MSISKKDKLKEIIWFISKYYNQNLYETKLWKLVFFVEADYFQKYREKISGVSFIKNKRGPTPSYSKAKKALEELMDNNYLLKNSDNTYYAKNEFELKYLDAQKIDAIKSTCEKYYRLTTKELCLLTHKDPVYLSAEKYNSILDFNFVDYREDEDLPESENNKEFELINFGKEIEKKLLKSLAF